MSYLAFLLWALVPPIVALAGVVYRVRDRINAASALRAVLYLVVIVVAYTTPWDNYLIYREVWWYGAERVLGVIGYVPVEEYGFMALQAVMTGLFTVVVYAGRFEVQQVRRSVFGAGMAVWGGVAAGGAVMLVFGSPASLYLGLITAWAGPVLAGTWWLGGRRFLAGGWRYQVAWGVPSLYLWLWDAYAIGDGIWTISETYTMGVTVGGLPLEEAVFFALTNVLVMQGVLLFWDQNQL